MGNFSVEWERCGENKTERKEKVGEKGNKRGGR